MPQLDRPAPGYDPEADGLPWYRRAMAQGAGYYLPSSLFAFIPLFFARYEAWRWPFVGGLTVLLLVFFLGSVLICHWREPFRWLWVAGLITTILLLALATGGDSRPEYYTPYATAVVASLIEWRQARVTIVLIALVALGSGLQGRETFGVIMALMGLALGWSIGAGLAVEHARAAQRRAEERSAVLAVAAERERIARDLHDILGHSLTTIAVQADLAGRLVGRDDAAARTQIESLAGVARQALADVRATASGMREVRLATEVASARSVLEAAGVECRTPSALPALDDARAELFGYVVREAVTNVVRHAGASVCTIEAAADAVAVADDGHGIRTPHRTGLAGLARRVEAAGGRLEVTSGPSGTRVRATLPAATASDLNASITPPTPAAQEGLR